jgi:hypothetical protein
MDFRWIELRRIAAALLLDVTSAGLFGSIFSGVSRESMSFG